MKRLFYLFFILFATPLLFTSCEDPDEEDPDGDDPAVELTAEEKANKKVNAWIWDEMDTWYLWTSYLPSQEDAVRDPDGYFESLLYSKDRWSSLASDYKTWKNSLQGITKSLGYSLALYYEDSEGTSIIGIVEFVYPNTPAAEAGLKRGDIIGEVNGTDLVLDNYVELLFETDDVSITLGRYIAGDLELADTSIAVMAEEIEENPVLHYEIIEREGEKIGYLVYVGFISNFNDDLNEAMAYFKAQGVDNLILDLRYNPGGDLGAAIELCSSIGPLADVEGKKILVNYQWNDELQAYIEQEAASDPGWNDNLRILFDNTVPTKLDLSNLYVLTTGGTASASELLITGLDPYMNVVKIGETTHGKYAASITIPDQDSAWALQPIVLRYANSLGITDFEDGFVPDHEVEDVLDFNFGDLNDPMVKKAVELITGVTIVARKSDDMSMSYGNKIGEGGRHQRIQDGILHIDNIHFPVK